MTRHKRQFFYTNIINPKKCKSYDKSNSQQDRVKGPKYPNNAKKRPKRHKKAPKYATKWYQKAQNCYITHFLDKTVLNFGEILHKIGIFLHQHCRHVSMFLHLWIWLYKGQFLLGMYNNENHRMHHSICTIVCVLQRLPNKITKYVYHLLVLRKSHPKAAGWDQFGPAYTSFDHYASFDFFFIVKTVLSKKFIGKKGFLVKESGWSILVWLTTKKFIGEKSFLGNKFAL